MHRAMFMVAAFLLSATFSVSAQGIVETDVEKIVAQQLEIQREAAAGKGRYRDMDAKTRASLAEHQQKVLRLVDGHARTSDMGQLDQLAVFNALEAISAIVNKAEDERMICRRERPVGSNRTVNTCRTVAQIREARQSLESRGGITSEGVCMAGDCTQ